LKNTEVLFYSTLWVEENWQNQRLLKIISCKAYVTSFQFQTSFSMALGGEEKLFTTK
jgi:hypothetical protein